MEISEIWNGFNNLSYLYFKKKVFQKKIEFDFTYNFFNKYILKITAEFKSV